MISLNWTLFKEFVSARLLSIQYFDDGSIYHCYAVDGEMKIHCAIIKATDTTEKSDFEANFKTAGNKSFTDADGTAITRPKAAKKGWVFGLVPVEITTATIGSVYSKLPDDTVRSGITLKIYDADNAEITDAQYEANAVKTVLDFEPSYDYELIGGTLSQHTKPNTNVRCWVVAAPDISANQGGSKEMVGGVNLKFIDPADKINADGRVSKYMQYNAQLHLSKLRVVFRHGAGVKHDVLIALEVFRQ